MTTGGGSSRRVLVTADDFGVSPQVNAEIERYFKAGALHRASLMVNGPAVDEAVAIARRNPGLDVGLHLTLCDGLASAVSKLTDSDRRLPRTPAAAGIRYAFCPWLHSALRQEIEAQFAAFRRLGLPPTYWDGHTHLHLHPTVLRLSIPFAHAHAFTFTRLVREPGANGLLPVIFNALSAAAIPALDRSGIAYADAVFGLTATGRMTKAAFQAALEQAGEGTTEIYFHPGAEVDPPSPEELAELLRSSGLN